MCTEEIRYARDCGLYKRKNHNLDFIQTRAKKLTIKNAGKLLQVDRSSNSLRQSIVLSKMAVQALGVSALAKTRIILNISIRTFMAVARCPVEGCV